MRRRHTSSPRPQIRTEDFRALIAAGTLKEVEGHSIIVISCERCGRFERTRNKGCTPSHTRTIRSETVEHVAGYHNTLLHEARALAELHTEEPEPEVAEA